MKDPRNLADQLPGIRCGLDVEGHRLHALGLLVGTEEQRRDVSLHFGVFRILRHADDLRIGRLSLVGHQLADGIGPELELANKCFVDNRDFRRLAGVLAREFAAGDERDAKRLEVVGPNHVEPGVAVHVRPALKALDRHVGAPVVSSEHRHDRRGHTGDTGLPRHLLFDPCEERL